MKNNPTVKAARVLFIRMAVASLWYIVIYALVMFILSVILMKTSGIPLVLAEHIAISNRIYLLVIGVIYPTVLKHYVAVGVTRGQFALGLSGAAVALSLCFSLLYCVVLLVNGSFSFLSVATGFTYAVLFFFIGWIAVLGFQLKRIYTAVIGLVCANGLFWGADWLVRAVGAGLVPVVAVVAVAVVVWVVVELSRLVEVRC
jgi:hypothetical protein